MQEFIIFELIILVILASLAVYIGRNSQALYTWFKSTNSGQETAILNAMPALIWLELDGKVVWANKEHDHLVEKSGSCCAIADFDMQEPLKENAKQCRAEFKIHNCSKIFYYDVSKHLFGKKTLYIAVSAKAAAEAEKDRARFVQTLSDTFAHLPIGMAVFDKERDLSLFNPALSQMLDINTLWLTKRPSLREFLDRLHDKGAIPEPRNFKSWRDQIVDMEQSAESGNYFDDWHMPNNKVFRVTGRPNRAGAVAFMFEDITRAVHAEREYRIEIERLYTALDFLEPAIAVFDISSTLTFANASFDTIWKTDFSKSLISPTALEVADIWNDHCEPSPLLGEIREFILSTHERANWTGNIQTKNGQTLDVRAISMAGGYCMIEFVAKGSLSKRIKKTG